MVNVVTEKECFNEEIEFCYFLQPKLFYWEYNMKHFVLLLASQNAFFYECDIDKKRTKKYQETLICIQCNPTRHIWNK